MLLAKVECKKVSVERLVEILSEYTEPSFKIWKFNKRIYAIFKLNSLLSLKKLTEKLRELKIKFNFYRIQEELNP